MSLAQLFADSVFARLFRGDTRHAQLVVSMVGVKLGDRLLVMGLTDPRVLVALAAKVGITGRACGVDTDAGAGVRAERAAARAGVLVEIVTVPDLASLPWEEGSFDVVVVRVTGTDAGQNRLVPVLGGARRVLRDGGRCLLVTEGSGRGARATQAAGEGAAGHAGLLGSLKSGGFRGARVLADREGMAFIEAVIRH